jgi:hypothetical protein
MWVEKTLSARRREAMHSECEQIAFKYRYDRCGGVSDMELSMQGVMTWAVNPT